MTSGIFYFFMPELYLSLVFVTFVWGGAFPAIAIALRHLTPYEILVYRHILAVICFLPWLKEALRSLHRRDLTVFIIVGALMVPVYHIGLNVGEMQVPPAIAGFIVSLTPVLTAVLASLFLKERHNLASIVGFLLGLSGVALMVYEGNVRGDFPWLWILWVFVPLFSSAINTILAKRLLARYDPIPFTTLSLTIGTFLSILLMPFVQPSFGAPRHLETWAALAFLGIFSNFIAYYLWFNALKRLSASRTVSFLYLVPVWGMVLSVLWAKEQITAGKLWGGVIVVAGVALGTQATNARLSRPEISSWKPSPGSDPPESSG